MGSWAGGFPFITRILLFVAAGTSLTSAREQSCDLQEWEACSASLGKLLKHIKELFS